MSAERRNLDRIRRARGDHTPFLASQVDEALLSMVMTLMGEVSVLRDRLDAHERLLAEGAAVSPAAVDAYVPGADAETDRRANRARIIEYVMRPLKERLLPEELGGMNQQYQNILEEVQRAG